MSLLSRLFEKWFECDSSNLLPYNYRNAFLTSQLQQETEQHGGGGSALLWRREVEKG